MSMMKFFRDHIGPPDSNTVNPEDYGHYIENKKEKREENEDEVKKVLIQTMEKIHSARLKKIFADDEVQQKLLKERIEKANELVLSVLRDVQNYMSIIESFDRVKKNEKELDQELFLKNLYNSDSSRKLKHNALISSLHITIRYIAHTFGQISEQAIENWEARLEEQGQEILEVERIKLPKNVICPDNVNLDDRKSIAKWAFNIYSSLSILEDKIKKTA